MRRFLARRAHEAEPARSPQCRNRHRRDLCRVSKLVSWIVPTLGGGCKGYISCSQRTFHLRIHVRKHFVARSIGFCTIWICQVRVLENEGSKNQRGRFVLPCLRENGSGCAYRLGFCAGDCGKWQKSFDERKRRLRPPRLELGTSAWKADVIPFHHGRVVKTWTNNILIWLLSEEIEQRRALFNAETDTEATSIWFQFCFMKRFHFRGSWRYCNSCSQHNFLFTILTCAQCMRVHFFPQHWLLWHLDFYWFEFYLRPQQTSSLCFHILPNLLILSVPKQRKMGKQQPQVTGAQRAKNALELQMRKQTRSSSLV